MKYEERHNTDEKLGIDKGAKVLITLCNSNGETTGHVEGNVIRVFPHNIVLDKGSVVKTLSGNETSRGKSYTIPMRWISSIEELD